MKKLGKLSISPEKIMKNEELINLQGGYQGWCCYCVGNGIMGGASNWYQCQNLCFEAWGSSAYIWSDEC